MENNIRTYDNIRKIPANQGDNYTTGSLLDCNYFKKHYKMIAIDLSKQQALDADSKAIHLIEFTGNIDCNNNRLIFSLLKKWKKPF